MEFFVLSVGGSMNPIRLFVEINTLCNYDCIFCYNSQCLQRQLSLQESFDLINSIPSVKFVDISGYGEILLHSNLQRILDKLSADKKQVSFSTNGFALTPDKIDFLESSSLYILNVSLNSLNPQTYEYLTQRNTLPQVLKNLDYLFSKKRKYRITISMVVTRYNIGELSEFVRYGKRKGTKIRFLSLSPNLTYSDDLRCEDTPQNRLLLENANKLAKELGVRVDTFGFDEVHKSCSTEKKKNCRAPFEQFCIGSSGNVRPCCNLNMDMGNVFLTPWQEIWNNQKYQALRASITDGSLIFCQNCKEFG
jgi:MoaA/NifB/PqqE/SkfB family radical SAM enzyme